MSIACSTAVRSQEPLAEALATIEKLGFEKVDVLAINLELRLTTPIGHAPELVKL